MTKLGLISAVVALALSGPLRAAEIPLKDVEFVREGLIDTAIAYELSRVCPDLSPRLIRGMFFLKTIQDYARDLGYSEAEIDAYVNDKEEKDRLEAIARTRLLELGAIPDEVETYCVVGRAQISLDNQIGRLLR